MSRRIDAYLTEKDQQEFLEFAIFEKNVRILNDFGTELSIKEVLNEEIVRYAVNLTFEGSELIFDECGEIDYDCSEVVGFEKGYSKKNRSGEWIREVGGLGMQTRYWWKDEDGESVLILKDKRNTQFYNSLARWMKKNYVISTDKSCYAAPDFYQKYKSGEINPSGAGLVIFE